MRMSCILITFRRCLMQTLALTHIYTIMDIVRGAPKDTWGFSYICGGFLICFFFAALHKIRLCARITPNALSARTAIFLLCAAREHVFCWLEGHYIVRRAPAKNVVRICGVSVVFYSKPKKSRAIYIAQRGMVDIVCLHVDVRHRKLCLFIGWQMNRFWGGGRNHHSMFRVPGRTVQSIPLMRCK